MEPHQHNPAWQSDGQFHRPSLGGAPVPALVPVEQQSGTSGMLVPSTSGVLTPEFDVSLEEIIYFQKLRTLSKYVAPLRTRIMVAKMASSPNANLIRRMESLLNILTEEKRVPLTYLTACEARLDRLYLRAYQTQKILEPLMNALKASIQSPMLNHTLHRTFGPCVDPFRSDWHSAFPPLRKRKLDEPEDKIPLALQGELARMDDKFIASLDPTGRNIIGEGLDFIFRLDEPTLPCLPPAYIFVPPDYPASSPKFQLPTHEYSGTAFLSRVRSAVFDSLDIIPPKVTVSQLLDVWEMAVRRCCNSQPEEGNWLSVAAATHNQKREINQLPPQE